MLSYFVTIDPFAFGKLANGRLLDRKSVNMWPVGETISARRRRLIFTPLAHYKTDLIDVDDSNNDSDDDKDDSDDNVNHWRN